MAELQRFDQLTAPPIAGKFYLVWCVRGSWYGTVKDWPMWGPKHEDAKFFNFPAPHYHINRYFVDDPRATTAPLADKRDYTGYPENDPLPPLVLRRRRCVTDAPHPFPVRRAARGAPWKGLESTFIGAQCKRGVGWICPHKGFDLAAMAPNKSGNIRCPLHGLLINAKTGRVGKKLAEYEAMKEKAGG